VATEPGTPVEVRLDVAAAPGWRPSGPLLAALAHVLMALTDREAVLPGQRRPGTAPAGSGEAEGEETKGVVIP
jgi:hypothetical protein